MTTVAMAIVVGVFAGLHGAVSSALGGAVALAACTGFVVVTQMARVASASATLLIAFRAEGVKVGLSVLLLWLVLSVYKEVIAVAFIGSFAVSILVFSMAVFVRDLGRKA